MDPSPPAEAQPDPTGVAAALLEDGDGKPASSTERVRRYRQRKKEQEHATEAPAPTVEVSSEDTGAMVAVMWETAIVPLVGNHRGTNVPKLKLLTPDQETRMGKAFAPLMTKYLPMLGPWQAEIAAAIVTVGVIRECVTPRPPMDLEPDAFELGSLEGATP